MANNVTKSNNQQGNPYHVGKGSSNGGQFTSPGGGGNSGSGSNQQPNFAASIDNLGNINFDDLDLSGIDFGDTSDFDFLNEADKFKFHEKRSVDETIEAIPELLDDDVIAFLKKHNFQSRDKNGTIYPAMKKTSHAYLNNPLINSIAVKHFVPLTVVSDAEFATLKASCNPTTNSAVRDKAVFIQRGFGNTKRMEEYVGNVKNDLPLTAGAYGSCVYTAYDNYSTANRYAGYGGFIMEAVIDNTQANVISYDDAQKLRRELSNKFDVIEQNIRTNLSNRGYDNATIDGVKEVVRKTLNNDQTSGAFFAGYDCVYMNDLNNGNDYSLVLSFKGTVTRKNW